MGVAASTFPWQPCCLNPHSLMIITTHCWVFSLSLSEDSTHWELMTDYYNVIKLFIAQPVPLIQ